MFAERRGIEHPRTPNVETPSSRAAVLAILLTVLFLGRASAQTESERALQDIREAISSIVTNAPWVPIGGPPSLRQILVSQEVLFQRTREAYDRLFRSGAKYPEIVFGELLKSEIQHSGPSSLTRYAGQWFVRADWRSNGPILARLYETGSCSVAYDAELERLIRDLDKYGSDIPKLRRKRVREFSGKVLIWSPHVVWNNPNVVHAAARDVLDFGTRAEIASRILGIAANTVALESLISACDQTALEFDRRSLRLLSFGFRRGSGTTEWKEWWTENKESPFEAVLRREMGAVLGSEAPIDQYVDPGKVLDRWVMMTGIDPQLKYVNSDEGKVLVRFSEATRSIKLSPEDVFARLRDLWSSLDLANRPRREWIRMAIENSFFVLNSPEANDAERKTAVFVISEYVNAKPLIGLSCMPISEWVSPVPDPAAIANAVRWWADKPSLAWDEESQEYYVAKETDASR